MPPMSDITEFHEKFMQLAIKQAMLAAEEQEIPVGAVIVNPAGKILAKSYNQVEKLRDPTAHAEILAITSACVGLGGKYLPGCTLYVTLEPCPMCAGAIKWSQLSGLVFGASDPKNGYRAQCVQPFFTPKTHIISGVLSDPCSSVLLDFFRTLR